MRRGGGRRHVRARVALGGRVGERAVTTHVGCALGPRAAAVWLLIQPEWFAVGGSGSSFCDSEPAQSRRCGGALYTAVAPRRVDGRR